MAGHMHFNGAGHAWDSETMVKQKTNRVNTTNPVPVPLAWKFNMDRIIIPTQLTPIHVFLPCMFYTNPPFSTMIMSG